MTTKPPVAYGNEITGDDLQKVGVFCVVLASAGNPDHGQDPEKPLKPVGGTSLTTGSVAVTGPVAMSLAKAKSSRE